MKMKPWVTAFIYLFTLVACSGLPTPPATNTPFPATATSPSTPTLFARPTDTALPTPSPAPAHTPTPSLTTLLLWENLPPAQLEKLKSDVAVFRASYPNYIIQIQHYDDPELLADSVVEERVDFDLLLGPATLLAPARAAGKLQSMNELLAASFLDGFASASLTGAAWGGQLWGLPDTAGFHLLLYYNLDLVDQPPASTEEMEALARSLTGDSRWGLVLNSLDPVWIAPWLWAYGGWLADGNGQATLNSEAMVKALDLYASWHGGSTPIAPVAGQLEARQLFADGRAAMLIEGEWAIDELSRETPFPWGVAPLPAITEAEQPPGPLVLGRYWAVGTEADGARAEAAIAFLEFITSAERQLVRTETFGLLPTRRDALASPQILTDPALRISAEQLRAGRGVPLGTDLNAILDAMRDPLEQRLSGLLTSQEAAEEMQLNVE
jgi:arabinogalactan oligomer/maltooligosaccharide transport system substrate-binding protein